MEHLVELAVVVLQTDVAADDNQVLERNLPFQDQLQEGRLQAGGINDAHYRLARLAGPDWLLGGRGVFVEL